MTANDLPSLADVQEAFSIWRRDRPTRQTPIELRVQAVALLQHYPITEVLRTLRLDHRRLSRWQRELLPDATPEAKPAFVELPPLDRQSSAESEPVIMGAAAPRSPALQLTLSRQDGAGNTVTISGTLETEHWRWALELLREGGA